MHLVLVTVLIAACGADKLDRTYLPPASANTAGGSPGSLQAPLRSFNQGLGGLPKGGYSNEFEGVVVDAAAPGTRASGDETGLGGPRIAYGSTDSKVGNAAFTADTAFPRVGVHAGLKPGSFEIAAPRKPERVQAPRDRTSNTVKYENDVNHDSFNYAFETDNGITAEENGVEVNGVKAQGGYSYTGDDGQVYSVTYTADEGGYQPRGDHLPTPPPIPQEILKSLEQNAKEEASGVIDDGSYNAQKYNTGEDYAKTDNTNGKYNGGQQTRPGNRPQSDADTSSSFINQNNQFFGATSSIQFGSTPTGVSSSVITGIQPFGSSVNAPSINAQKITQKGQTTGFGSSTNNEYLPPYSGFNQNRRPSSNNRPIQNNLPSGFLQETASSGQNTNGDANKDQSSQIPTFIPLSQQKLQDNSKKPNTPIFGKPTIIDSSLSIKDPFARRPSSNRFSQNKQPNQKPLSTGQVGGSFEVVSGNVYSSKNEYLPPHRQFNKNKGNQGFQGSSFTTQPNQQPIGSKPQTFTTGPTSSTTSTFGSVSRPSLGFQSFQQYNNQQSPQYAGNSQSSQLNQFTNNRVPLNNNQPQFDIGHSNAPVSETNQYKPSSFASQSPTLVPQTVLTTPLESNSNKNKESIPVPVIDGPDSSKGSSNLSSFVARPSNSFVGHSSFNNNKVQQVAPTQASAFASSSIGSQSSSPGHQNVPRPGLVVGNFGDQFPNKSPIDVQYSPSTQRPSFSQNTQQQGADDSYIYNTPSKPFNVPTSRPQTIGFPSTTFDQSFKVTQTPFATRPLPSSFQTSFTSQNNQPVGSSRLPFPSTLEPISPTLTPSQAGQNGDSFQSQFNKVTQASASSFPSPVPTASSNFDRNQYSQFGTRPSQVTNSQFKQEAQGLNLSNQPGTTFAHATAIHSPISGHNANQRLPGTSTLDSIPNLSTSQQTQQYGGELYEYNKPPQSLPVPQTGVTSGQFGSSSITPQTGSQNSEAYKPSTQFGSKFTQQTILPFGQTPQNSQQQYDSRPGLFGSFSSKPTQNTQLGLGNEPFNTNTQKQSQSESRPGSFGSPLAQPTYTTQTQGFNFNEQAQKQHQTVIPSGHFSSQPSKPSQGASNGHKDFNLNREKDQPQSEFKPGPFGSVPKPQNSQPIQGASKFPPAYTKPGPACCQQAGFGSQSSQDDQKNQQNGTPQFSQNGANNEFGLKEPTSQDTRPVESISSFPGVSETFGGPRKPPSFDASGYHY